MRWVVSEKGAVSPGKKGRGLAISRLEQRLLVRFR